MISEVKENEKENYWQHFVLQLCQQVYWQDVADSDKTEESTKTEETAKEETSSQEETETKAASSDSDNVASEEEAEKPDFLMVLMKE